ncbi:MAG TPA: sulfur oxidation c-type cytochrome SoxX [Burkholderiales bacterium]|nr:sulfur oxidation c-type cytochrome SoxX [Burkholderiales bacterium]
MKRALLLALLSPLAAQAGDPARGKRIVLAPGEGDCLRCHAVPGADRPAGTLGPSLAGVGSRLSQEEIFWRIVDASRFNPDTAMPAYGRIQGARSEPQLSTFEIEDAAAFLATLK